MGQGEAEHLWPQGKMYLAVKSLALKAGHGYRCKRFWPLVAFGIGRNYSVAGATEKKAHRHTKCRICRQTEREPQGLRAPCVKLPLEARTWLLPYSRPPEANLRDLLGWGWCGAGNLVPILYQTFARNRALRQSVAKKGDSRKG